MSVRPLKLLKGLVGAWGFAPQSLPCQQSGVRPHKCTLNCVLTFKIAHAFRSVNTMSLDTLQSILKVCESCLPSHAKRRNGELRDHLDAGTLRVNL
jgi:hypothetical protein